MRRCGKRCIGLVGGVVAAVTYCFPAVAKLQEAQMVNQRALSQVNCSGSTCDTSSYTTTSWLEGPDYFIERIDEQTRYFVDVPLEPRAALQPRLQYLDLDSHERFRWGTWPRPAPLPPQDVRRAR